MAGQGGAGQGRAGQGRAGQGRAGQGMAGQGRAGLGMAGQGKTGQGWAEQGRAKQGRAALTLEQGCTATVSTGNQTGEAVRLTALQKCCARHTTVLLMQCRTHQILKVVSGSVMG